MEQTTEILIYQAEDNETRIETRLLDETVWFTQQQMAELFSKDKRTISEHIGNIYKEGELVKESTVRKFRTVQKEGNRSVERDREHFNLDVIYEPGQPVALKQVHFSKTHFLPLVQKKIFSYIKKIPGLSNNWIRSWFASLSQSILIRYLLLGQFVILFFQ